MFIDSVASEKLCVKSRQNGMIYASLTRKTSNCQTLYLNFV